VVGLLTNLHESLGPDGLPPSSFQIASFELLVLGTGGFVGLAALFLGREALREIHQGASRIRGARLAVTGLLGIPVGLSVKFAPWFCASAVRWFGWLPSSGAGEIFTGAVIISIFLLSAWTAWALRRWAVGTVSGRS
jgi:hypothetical protein